MPKYKTKFGLNDVVYVKEGFGLADDRKMFWRVKDIHIGLDGISYSLKSLDGRASTGFYENALGLR